MTKAQPCVGLFVTCLVDFLRPSVAFAAVRLLEDAGCRVEVPRAQTCCGQPAYNSGDKADSRAIAAQVIRAFEDYDYVVAPSGSCAAMLRHHYPGLFAEDPEMAARARALAERCHELVSFLVDVRQVTALPSKVKAQVTYHDSCAGLRELDIKAQPRSLLSAIDGITLMELEDAEVCCGFGGTFCVKYPEISNKMTSNKTDCIERSEAGLLLAGDLGCLMNMAGKLKREGSKVEVRHIAEVLADMCDQPAIGEAVES
jgi:L-lactate dehydrogenase complex protein LldE